MQAFVLVLALAPLCVLSADVKTLYESVKIEYTDTCDAEYVVANNALTGVKMYKDEIYVTVPRWRHGVPATLSRVVSVDGTKKFEPWPSCAMQTIGDDKALQYVQSMEVDTHGRMWVIDVGRVNIYDDPQHPPINTVPPKLMIIDIETAEVLHTHVFPDSVASHNTSFLNDIVVDEVRGFAYISDAGTGAIVVYDHSADRSRRFSGPSTQRDPSIKWVIDGVDYGTGNFTIPEDGIALTPNTEMLFFNALQGIHLYSVPTIHLRNFSATSKDIEGHVSDHGTKKSPSDGMAFSDNGKMYFGALMLDGLFQWDIESKLEDADFIAHSDTDLQWIDTFAFNGKGSIVFTANKLQRYFTRTMDFDTTEPNFRVLSLYIDGNSYINGEHMRTEL